MSSATTVMSATNEHKEEKYASIEDTSSVAVNRNRTVPKCGKYASLIDGGSDASKSTSLSAIMDSPAPIVNTVRWAMDAIPNRDTSRGSTSSSIIPFISAGTPGMDT